MNYKLSWRSHYIVVKRVHYLRGILNGQTRSQAYEVFFGNKQK